MTTFMELYNTTSGDWETLTGMGLACAYAAWKVSQW